MNKDIRFLEVKVFTQYGSDIVSDWRYIEIHKKSDLEHLREKIPSIHDGFNLISSGTDQVKEITREETLVLIDKLMETLDEDNFCPEFNGPSTSCDNWWTYESWCQVDIMTHLSEEGELTTEWDMF